MESISFEINGRFVSWADLASLLQDFVKKKK